MTPTGEPLRITGFNGLWSRGQADSCPPDHLTACTNCSFPGPSQIKTREAFSLLEGLPTDCISYFYYVVRTALSQRSGFLYLNSIGELRDNVTGVLLAVWPGTDDFAAINLFGRVYLSPKHIGRATIGTGFVYYYDGTNFTLAAGQPPFTPPVLTETAPGDVPIGVHKVFVAYQTRTGFVTSPSPGDAITSDGAHNIHIANIPVGGPEIVARVLLITRANEEEMFFVPGGTINDNVTTTFDYDNFDTSLVISADYLNDVLALIPAVAAFKFYRGRLVYIGRNFDPDTTMLSRIDDPETIDVVNGILTAPSDFYVSGMNGATVIRDVLYLMKPNATYSTQDSGEEPANWKVSEIDSGLGAFDTGMSGFASALSAQDIMDSALVVNQRGLMLFTGSYHTDALTWKIETLWQSIDPTLFYKIQIAHDIWLKRVYISVPLTGSVSCNFILLMDYSDGGLSSATVKWSIWSGLSSNFTKIGTILLSPNFTAGIVYKLAIASGGSVIHTLDPASHADDGGILIISSFRTALLAKSLGDMSVYTLLRLRVFGFGNINFVVLGQSDTVFQTPRGFNLSFYTQGQDLDRLLNFTSEKIRIQINNDIVIPGTWFQIQRIDLFGARKWLMRPALTESL